MYLDVAELREFYGARLGMVARRLIGARLKEHWPSLAAQSLLGIGYATPYLRTLGEGAERVMAFMPATQGVTAWPREGPNATALVVGDDLPLNDASVDRVLLIHCLETVAEERDQLREIWRVLSPGGRLIIVVPNRQGIWAHVEATPFGTGRPFGRTQLTALLRQGLFTPIGWSEALAAPPFRRRSWLRTGEAWERVGRRLWPAFAGVLIVEAEKQMYQGIPSATAEAVRAGREPALTPALIPPGA
jgi:SAM-dependent methyltransferase